MATFDYYFEKEKLVFIYEVFSAFFMDDSTGTLNYEKTLINFIGRYYLQDNKLIDNETTGHNRFEDDEIDMERLLLVEMNDSMLRLKKYKDKIKPATK